MHNDISYPNSGSRIWITITLFCLLFFAFPNTSSAEQRQFEDGAALTGVDHRTIYNQFEGSTSRSHETDFYLKLRQNTVNFGRIEADVVYSMIDLGWDPEGWSGKLGIKKFYLGTDTLMDFYMVDTELDFRTVPRFFTNYQIPPVYFRGINSVIEHKKKWKLKFYWGYATRRRGTLGRAFTRTDQQIFGLNLGIKLPRDSFLGIGYLGTRNEEDFAGNPLTKYNNIFLADARLGIVKDLVIMGEYLQCLYDQAGVGKFGDYSIVAGPSWKKPKHEVVLNYRRLGKNFSYANNSATTVTNQEGVFVRGTLNVKEEHRVYLYGTGNFYWDQPTPGSGRGRTYTLDSNLGTTVYPNERLYITGNFSITKRNADGDTDPLDNLRYQPILGASIRLIPHKLDFYTRLRYMESRVIHPQNNTTRRPDGRLGLKWHLTRRFEMDFETEITREWDTIDSRDQLQATATTYIYWRPISAINLSASSSYGRIQDYILDGSSNTVSADLNYSHRFRRGWSMQITGRWSRQWGLTDNSNYQARVKFEKRFYWGKTVLRYGIPRRGLPIVAGDITGYVFIDENGDGIKQPWEKGMPDIPIILDGIVTVRTDLQGKYEFVTVLIGERNVQMDVKDLAMNYVPEAYRKKIDVKLRQTANVDFPVTVTE